MSLVTTEEEKIHPDMRCIYESTLEDKSIIYLPGKILSIENESIEIILDQAEKSNQTSIISNITAERVLYIHNSFNPELETTIDPKIKAIILTSPPRISLITPNLYLGDLAGSIDTPLLTSLGITHILTLGDESSPATLPRLKISIVDLPWSNLLDILPLTSDFIDAVLASAPNARLYVHCAYGQSRSASVVIAWWMRKHGVNYPEARDAVRKKRAVVKPNKGFKVQLGLWSRSRFGTEISLGVEERYREVRDLACRLPITMKLNQMLTDTKLLVEQFRGIELG